jgi:hypothetical protein
VWGGSKIHSTLRPLNGLLCQPRVIMIMEISVEWLARETEVLGENLPQCRFVIIQNLISVCSLRTALLHCRQTNRHGESNKLSTLPWKAPRPSEKEVRFLFWTSLLTVVNMLLKVNVIIPAAVWVVDWGEVPYHVFPYWLFNDAVTSRLYSVRWKDDNECGIVSGTRIGRGNRSVRRKSCPVTFCPPQLSHNMISNPGRHGGKRATSHLSYGTAMLSCWCSISDFHNKASGFP